MVEPSSLKDSDDSNDKSEKIDTPKKASIFEKWKNSDAGRLNSPKPTTSSEETGQEASMNNMNLFLEFERFFSSFESQFKDNKRKNESQESEEASAHSSKKHDVEIGSNNLSPNKSKTYFKPKETIFKGVIFALSGFQNPLRSELRDKGMKLGAKYRPDWTDDCTHLM
jgi:hypothetical protein